MNRVSRRTALCMTVAGTLLAAMPAWAQDAGFPFTYTHAFGKTTVPAKPRRVVSLSFSGNGLTQVAGAELVGAWRNPYSANGQDPWLAPYAEGTELLAVASGGVLNFEQIAVLAPDVIIAIDSAVPFSLADNFERLNSIAPTIVPVDGDRAQTYLTTSAALGEQARVAALIESVDARIAQIRDRLAGAGNRSVAYGQARKDEIGIQVDPEIAPSVQLLAALGFEPPAGIVAAYDKGAARTPGTVHYSWESAGAIDAADLVLLGANGVTEAELAANPMFERLTVRREGRLHMISTELLLAVMLYGPHNADWILDRLEPILDTLAE